MDYRDNMNDSINEILQLFHINYFFKTFIITIINESLLIQISYSNIPVENSLADIKLH